MDPRERSIVIVVSVVIFLWMILLAARFVFVPFDDVDDRSPPEDVALKIGFLDWVDSLNPYVGLNEPSHFFYGLVYDCLTTMDEEMKVTGNLALSWHKVPITDPAMVASGEPYGSVWAYNLTHNAVWHDGVQFTADDVLYIMNMNSEHYDLMWGYQPYTYFIKEAEKVDNYTVRIHFWNRATGDPMPVAWGDFIPIHILPKHMLEQLPGGYSYIGMNWTGTYTNDTSPGLPLVGTGPWMVTPTLYSDWIAGDKITLVANPSYHWKTDKPGAPEVRVDQLIMRFFQDSTSQVLALKNGELDATKLAPIAYDAIKDDIDDGSLRNVSCFSGPSCAQGLVYLSFWMDVAGGPNDARLDPDVRKAMAMAIDRSYIATNMYVGLADPGSTVVPPVNSPWHYEPTSTEIIPFNATAASDLLESSGYIDINSDGIRECTFSSRAVQMGWVDEGTPLHFEVPVLKYHPEDKDTANYLKVAWGGIGVNMSYLIYDYSVWPLMCPIQQDVSISHWYSLDPDPEYILFTQSYAGMSGWSDTRYSNSSYDDCFNLSASTLDYSSRKMYTDDCQRILYEESPYIVLAYPYSNFAWRDDVIGGWGDWTTDPGRSLDAMWGANPLFFDLSPPVYAGNSESEPSVSSLALNIVIVAAAVCTVAVAYFVWKRGPRVEPPKTE